MCLCTLIFIYKAHLNIFQILKHAKTRYTPVYLDNLKSAKTNFELKLKETILH